MESWEGEKIGVAGYVRDTGTGRDITTTAPLFPVPGKDYTLEFVIPEVDGSQVDEVGIILTGFSGAARRDSGRLLVDLFEINGKARYSIDFARQAIEFGCVTPFSHDGGNWAIEDGRMRLMTDVAAAAYTGGHAVADQRVSASLVPLAGTSHLLVARAAGAMRSYLAGFDGARRVSMLRKDFGLSALASTEFAWEPGREYRILRRTSRYSR